MRAILCLLVVLLGTAGAFAVPQNDDPYTWLEDVHGPKPLAWVAEQNKTALGLLQADPRYQTNYDSILSVLDAPDRIAYGGLDHGFVYNFWQDAKNPKGVWRRTTIADYQAVAPHWDVLLDLDALAKAEQENWVWEGADCAPSGKPYCLISLSRGGGDAKVVREFDLASRSFLKNGFHLAEAKSTVQYGQSDEVVFFASDFGKGSLTTSGYPRAVKVWKRSGAIKTLYEGQTGDVLVQPMIFNHAYGSVALIARAVSFFETEYFRIGPENDVTKLPLPLSADVKGVTGHALIFTLRQDWQVSPQMLLHKGALVAMALDHDGQGAMPALKLLYQPDARSSIESVACGRDKVYAVITQNVLGRVEVFQETPAGWVAHASALPQSAQGTADIISANDFGPEMLFSFQNYLTPPTLYLDAGDEKPKAIKALPARFDASGMVTEQFEAVSKDGTKIPYFVTRPKTLHGAAPAILYGYGGFEVSLTPSYSANFGRLWVAKGGVYVVANIRGGGEFGPAWHDAALKTNRQRAFDDFAAVAADLEKRGLTTPKQLGIVGGSNGGLLVSTVMVQHPELLGAVVCQVPLIDMIAYSHIGAGASWIGEYGDPADPKMRDYILTYSPYQNVKAGVQYPPVFFVTATSDDRVTPVHARKMAAKMQAQGHEVLFYENTDGGHAAAADHKQNAQMWALTFAYLAGKLGLK